MEYDVAIIGAGAAGLIAAYELSKAGKSVIVSEARDRIGGRVHTVHDVQSSLPVELGAEFVHGNLPVTLHLLKESGIPYHKVKGAFWTAKNGKLKKDEEFIDNFSEVKTKLNHLQYDISVADFLQNYLQEEKFADSRASLKSYVEGYDAADPHKASTFALRNDLMQSDAAQYRIDGGYQKLLFYLSNSCEKHSCPIHLSSRVTHIHWQKDKVTIVADGKTITAKKAIITVPLGVLQAEPESAGYIHFIPDIDEKIQAARALGFGNVIKIILLFSDNFWKEKGMETMSFLFSEELVPTWWTQYPNQIPMLTGWLAGPKAVRFKNTSEEEMLQKSLTSLSSIFKIPVNVLHQKLVRFYLSNWLADPFCNGGYSYETVSGTAFRKLLKTPVDTTLFFAGEAFHEGPEIGTVEAALTSGKETAEQVLALL